MQECGQKNQTVQAGFRIGFSSSFFKWSLIQIENPYWDYSYRPLQRDAGPFEPGDLFYVPYTQAIVIVSSIGPECQNGALIIG